MKIARGIVVVMALRATIAMADDARGRIVREIAAIAHTTPAVAGQTENALVAFMSDLQDRFSYLATSRDSEVVRENASRDTIQNCFVGPESVIEVSSALTNTRSRPTVSRYFNRLIHLRDIYGYTNVTLYFDPNYLGMGTVSSVAGQRYMYEISVSATQIFIAKVDNVVVYSDATTKQFRVRFWWVGNGEVKFRVQEVTAVEWSPGPTLREGR